MDFVFKNRVDTIRTKMKNMKQRQETAFWKKEMEAYLTLITENCIIVDFLEYDACHRLADNYLIAMVFVFFKRAGLNSSDFTQINFFAALLLAHDMVEEDDSLIPEILHFSLPSCSDNTQLLTNFQNVKFLLFQAAGMRGLVTKTHLDKVMSIAPHPVWNRKRDPLHSGAAHLPSVTSPPGRRFDPLYDWRTSTCNSCRHARKKLLGYK